MTMNEAILAAMDIGGAFIAPVEGTHGRVWQVLRGDARGVRGRIKVRQNGDLVRFAF